MSSEHPPITSSWPIAGIVVAVEQHRRRLEHLLDELDILVARLEDSAGRSVATRDPGRDADGPG
jgi:hypothetical protein